MSAHTPGPWTVETMGHETTMMDQCTYLMEGENTPDEWQPIMISDDDGPCEVVALAHPLNAHLIAAAPRMLEILKAALTRFESESVGVHAHIGAIRALLRDVERRD